MGKEIKRLLLISGNIEYVQHVGGVGMHVHRLLERLVKPEVVVYSTSDYKVDGFIKQFNRVRKADVVHLHVSNPYMRLVYAIATRLLGKKCILTVHGNYGRFNGFKNYVDKLAMELVHVPVLINKESFEKVRKFNKKAVLLPAFILPVEGEEVLSRDAEELIGRIKKTGKPLFITSTNHRAFSDDGKEIYGIEFLVNYFLKHQEYQLLVLDPFSEYKQVYGENLSDNITILSGTYSFCGAVKLANVVVRNTPTDGDAFSVKEALWLHKPTIVTDAVSRPEGVFLFHYNDENSFEKAITLALSSKEEISLKEDDGISGYRKLYKQLGVIV